MYKVDWDKRGPAKHGECTWCKKPIIHGLDNTIKIQRRPEAILDLDGNPIGFKEAKVSAYLHPACWEEITDQPAICKYCGVFCVSKVYPIDEETKDVDLETGKCKIVQKTKPIFEVCGCACHKNAGCCTFLAPPKELENTLKRLKLWKNKEK
jgi:hypothetical protein